MLRNEHEFRRILYEFQRDGEINSDIFYEIEKILIIIERKNEMAKYLYRLVEKIDFYKLFNWEKIDVEEEEIKHVIELDGVSIHFSIKDDYYYLASTFLNNFFSNLISEINLSNKILGFLFVFPRKSKGHPYLHDIKKRLNDNIPTHELSLLYTGEFSNNPKSWLYSLNELRNDLHHSEMDIHEIIPEPEFDIQCTLSDYEGPFFMSKKYFGSSVPEEKREVNFFCDEVLKKTEWFLSEIYRILSDDLKVKNCVPLHDLRLNGTT